VGADVFAVGNSRGWQFFVVVLLWVAGAVWG
jgi:hypothetical protein